MSEESFLCSKCGEIPEILNVHTDNNKIEFKCKNCGIIEVLINDYFDELAKNNYFKKCRYCEKNDRTIKYYYCFDCREDFCEKCKDEKHSGHNYIEADEKKTVCLKHKKQFTYFCFDDQENLCDDDINFHRNHKIEEIQNYNSYLTDINIEKINEQLQNIIEINNLILNNEEYFINSIKNIGKSFEEGNKRDSKDIKYLLNGLSKDIEFSNKAIDKLKHKEIKIYRKDKYLHLYNRDLKDEGFGYISQIRFNQLKEIDISKNKITDIKPFNKMILPFLEFLNLSDNEIQNIEPVANLKSKNLQYIFLQKNQIEEIEPFSKSYFPALKILRVEGNNNIDGENEQNEEEKKKKKESFNKIKKKFSEKFIYKSLKTQLIEFIKKYNLGIYKFNSSNNKNNDNDNELHVSGEEECSEELQLIPESGNEDKDKEKIEDKDEKNVVEIVGKIVKIDLYDKNGGDNILKYLFLIITYSTENKIKQLILRNNNIKDASFLARINFSELKTLDLAVNEIKDSNFLTDIRADNLVNLYLDNNYFKDFYPILNVDVNEILNSDILNKVEENELKELYKESDANRSKDVEPLLKAKFKKLKNLSTNDQNVSDSNNKKSKDDELRPKTYKLNNECAFQPNSPEI